MREVVLDIQLLQVSLEDTSLAEKRFLQCRLGGETGKGGAERMPVYAEGEAQETVVKATSWKKTVTNFLSWGTTSGAPVASFCTKSLRRLHDAVLVIDLNVSQKNEAAESDGQKKERANSNLTLSDSLGKFRIPLRPLQGQERFGLYTFECLGCVDDRRQPPVKNTTSCVVKASWRWADPKVSKRFAERPPAAEACDTLRQGHGFTAQFLREHKVDMSIEQREAFVHLAENSGFLGKLKRRPSSAQPTTRRPAPQSQHHVPASRTGGGFQMPKPVRDPRVSGRRAPSPDEIFGASSGHSRSWQRLSETDINFVDTTGSSTSRWQDSGPVPQRQQKQQHATTKPPLAPRQPRRWRDPGATGMAGFGAPPALPTTSVYRPKGGRRKEDEPLAKLLGTLLQGAQAMRGIAELPVGSEFLEPHWGFSSSGEERQQGQEPAPQGYYSEDDHSGGYYDPHHGFAEEVEQQQAGSSPFAAASQQSAPPQEEFAPASQGRHWDLPAWCKLPPGGGRDNSQGRATEERSQVVLNGGPGYYSASQQEPRILQSPSPEETVEPLGAETTDLDSQQQSLAELPAHWQLPAWCKVVREQAPPRGSSVQSGNKVVGTGGTSGAVPSASEKGITGKGPSPASKSLAGAAFSQPKSVVVPPLATPQPPDLYGGVGAASASADVFAGGQASSSSDWSSEDSSKEATLGKKTQPSPIRQRRSSLSPRSPRGRRG